MCLAVNAEQCAVRVDHCNGIEQPAAVALIEADWQHDGKLLCKLHAAAHGGVILCFLRKCVIFIAPLLTKILPLKKLRQQDDLCAVCGSLADRLFRFGKAFCGIGTARHLDGGGGNKSAHGSPP